MIAFVKAELEGVEKALKFRLDAQKCWASGTDESWRAVGCRKTKAQRLKESALHGRVAIKYHQRIEIFNAILNELLAVKR